MLFNSLSYLVLIVGPLAAILVDIHQQIYKDERVSAVSLYAH